MYNGNTSPITILFEGLMVFCKNEANDRYEFGVLAPDVAVDHEFKIAIDSGPADEPPIDVEYYKRLGNIWTMDVVDIDSGSIKKNFDKVENGHEGRLIDTPTGQYDFSWVMDLESDEFHRGPLHLQRGKLTPIIHLTSGIFFTKYKSIALNRRLGAGEFSAFGFVAETLGVDIVLQPNEELVFRVANAGEQGVIFRLRDSAQVIIGNTPIPHDEHTDQGPTHFQHYYKLFPKISDGEKFELGPAGVRPARPINVHPKFENEHLRTCCGMVCGKVLLSRRKTPLE